MRSFAYNNIFLCQFNFANCIEANASDKGNMILVFCIIRKIVTFMFKNRINIVHFPRVLFICQLELDREVAAT